MKVTVFTPTYNRAKLIGDLYKSLCEQTCYDFEWLIVDDGSEDDTQKIVEGWIEKCNNFSIRYIYKSNGGKHTAINMGAENALGKYFFIVDSDDYLAPNAIQDIIRGFETIPSAGYAGVGFLRCFENGEIIGTTFDSECIDATALERNKYMITGDKAEVYYTEIIRKYPFPVFEGERFLTEALVWYRISNDGFKIRWYNKAIYFCRYQMGGLSMNSGEVKAPEGYSLYIKELLTYNTDVMTKIKPLGVYAYSMKKNGYTYKYLSKKVKCSRVILFALCNVYKLKMRLFKKSRIKELNIQSGE